MANNTRSVLVVGLGRFGSSVATTLDTMGQDVLAVDKDGELVNRWSSQIPTVQADMTDVMALEQINASDFDTAVVAIGDSVEASVITAGNLLDAGISDIWAKSVSKEHARILQRIGARHIINAETDAGKRVGHLVSGNYLDYIELEGAYSVVKIHTPPHVVGYSIEDARVHERFGITVVGVKSPGKEFEYGSKELIMHRNDELIIMGKQDQIDKFFEGLGPRNMQKAGGPYGIFHMGRRPFIFTLSIGGERFTPLHTADTRCCRACLRSVRPPWRVHPVRWLSRRR